MKIKNGMTCWVRDWSYSVNMYGEQYAHEEDIRSLQGFILTLSNIKKPVYEKILNKWVVNNAEIKSLKTGKSYRIRLNMLVFSYAEAKKWYDHYAWCDRNLY